MIGNLKRKTEDKRKAIFKEEYQLLYKVRSVEELRMESSKDEAFIRKKNIMKNATQ